MSSFSRIPHGAASDGVDFVALLRAVWLQKKNHHYGVDAVWSCCLGLCIVSDA